MFLLSSGLLPLASESHRILLTILGKLVGFTTSFELHKTLKDKLIVSELEGAAISDNSL
jgi:hypothetical protein